MLTRDFVSALNDNVLTAIRQDYIGFQNNGFIGDSFLRSYAKKFMETIGTSDNVTLWMREIYVASIEELLARTEDQLRLANRLFK